MPPAKNPAAPKPQSLGTRVGKLLNKLEKIEAQRDAALLDAPKAIEARYDERRAKAIAEADNDVLDKLGLERDG
jgi:hypothetical protein